MEKLLLKLNTWYLEKEGEFRKHAIFLQLKLQLNIEPNSNFDLSFLSGSLTLLLPEPVYKSSCVLTVHAISHYSPDVLKGHAGVALPLAFLGMHQAPGPDEEKGESHDATLWTEVWQENVPGDQKYSFSIGLK